MSKRFGLMISGHDALELLKRIEATLINNEEREKIERMNHRFEYLVDQSMPVEVEYHKGIYGKKYDSWTCGNCGCGINYGVIQNYCWNCGHAIKWPDK